MIHLFSVPKVKIDIGPEDHLLHGKVVNQFEEEFAEYVGAKYCVAVNSCTMAIFLVLTFMKEALGICGFAKLSPYMPVVVLNAVKHAGWSYQWCLPADWIGRSYELVGRGDQTIIDSAQEVCKNKCSENYYSTWLYSFYPTKPVGGIDGGMIATNSKAMEEWLRVARMNGCRYSENSWSREHHFAGWKAYMSTVQATVAINSLRTLDERMEKLTAVGDYYDARIPEDRRVGNPSQHLYRVVGHPKNACVLGKNEIVFGCHYPPISDSGERTVLNSVSIPFHHNLTRKEQDKVCRVIDALK